MIAATIDASIPEAVRALSELAQRQIPFATALALTWTAGDARDAVRRDIRPRFILRRPWVEQGIRATTATKRRPQALVYSRDGFMILQEFGGIKHPRRRHIALPRDVRTDERQLIPRGKRPAKLLQRTRTFIAPVRNGDKGIFQRVGKRRYPIRLMYRLDISGMKIESRFNFRLTVGETVRLRWHKNFGKAFARARASRK